MANKLLAELLELKRPDDITQEELKTDLKQLEVFEPGTQEFNKIAKTIAIRGYKIPPNYLYIVLSNWYENFTQYPSYEQIDQTEAPEYKPQAQTTVNEELNEPIFEEAQKRTESNKQAREKAESDVKRGIERQQQLYEERITRELKNKKVVVVPTEPIPTVKLTDQDKEVLFTASQEAKKNPSTSTDFFKERISESLSQADIEYQENITPAVIEKTAVSITENLRSLPDWQSVKDIPTEVPSINPVSPVVAMTQLEDARLQGILTDEEARKKAVEMAQNFALGLESENIVNLAGARSVFWKNENIALAFYGPSDGHITQFEIAEKQDEQRDEGVEIDIESIYDNGKKFYDLWGKIRSGTATANEVVSTSLTYVPTYTYPTSTKVAVQTSSVLTKALPAIGSVYGFRQGMLLQHWTRQNVPLLMNPQVAGFLTNGSVNGIVISSSALTSKTVFNFQLGKFSLQAWTSSGQGINAFTAGAKFGEKFLAVSAAKTSTSAAIATTSSKAGMKIFSSAALAKLGATLGSWAPIIGNIVGAALGWLFGKVLEKIDWTKVKKFFKEVLGPLLLVGGGFLLGAPALGLAAGGLAFGAARGLTLAGIGFGIWNFFRTLGGAFVTTIATPIIITLLVLPPLVAFIMLVINTGAYLVPPDPKSMGLNVDNPYMLVTKKADPDTIGNFSGKTTVTYTVTITALKTTLTNLKITEKKCTVSKKNASSVQNCPDGLETIPDLPADLSVSPSSPYSFTFTAEFDGSLYADSSIFDSIKIKGDTEEKKGIETSGSESVCIGDCPHGCFVLADNSETWPANYKSTLEGATQELTSRYPNFVDKACSERSEINLCYTSTDPSPIGEGGLCNQAIYGFHSHSQECDILFNQCGLGNGTDAIFLLTHELTHHIQKFDGSIIDKYKSAGAPAELPFCSYSGTNGNNDEGSAEANGLFVSIPSWASCIGGVSGYKQNYSHNYNFANSYMNNP